jgi:glycogen synthase
MGSHCISPAAQMIHRKGLRYSLRACEKLKNMNWRLTLVGEGHLRPKLEREFSGLFPRASKICGEVPTKAARSFHQAAHFVFLHDGTVGDGGSRGFGCRIAGCSN